MHTPLVADVKPATRSYGSGTTLVPALRNATVAVSKGELVALSGPSGSGKSTLLHLIGCLDRPDSGDIFLGDLRVSHMGPGSLAAVRRTGWGSSFSPSIWCRC